MYGQLRKSLSFWTSIFILVGVSITFAQSDPPPPTPSKTGQKPEANPAQHNEAPAKDQRGTESLPLFIKVIPSTTVEPEPSKEHKETNSDTSAEWWLVYVTGVLCAITLALAFFTGWLWNATKKLVVGAENTAKHELRAYIGVERIRINQAPSDPSIPGRWNIKIRNFGKTMAKDTEVWIAHTIGDGVSDIPLGDRKSKTVVMPNEAMGFDEAIEITQENFGLFRQGSAGVYIRGKITYKDVFGNDRWTTFRFRIHKHDIFFSRESVQNEWKARTDGEGANDAC